MSSAGGRRRKRVGRQGHIDATVELVRGDTAVIRWPLQSLARPDLGVVDQLARLQLLARRLGCRIRLRDVCPELRDLLDLVGLGEIVSEPAGAGGG